MSLKIDLGGLAGLANRFDDRFVNKFAVKAVEGAAVEGAGRMLDDFKFFKKFFVDDIETQNL